MNSTRSSNSGVNIMAVIFIIAVLLLSFSQRSLSDGIIAEELAMMDEEHEAIMVPIRHLLAEVAAQEQANMEEE
jgi:uncharacterized membrane protein